MTELCGRGIHVVAGGRELLSDLSISVASGELVAVLGPNGAGKTTLLRALLGLLPCARGTATLDGEVTQSIAPAARARRVAYLPQSRPLAWPNPVRDVVALGRYAHGATLGRLGRADAEAVDAAIASCDLDALARRGTDTLSGGELARVHVARALAAHADLLLADEPVAALDPRQQWRIAGTLRRYVDAGGGVLAVLHEVALAAQIADRLVFLREGRLLADGAPGDILTPDLLGEVYGVRASVTKSSAGIDVRIEAAL